MKCPECHFSCSDLRDLCPKCTSDLRSFKKSVGIEITNSEASYKELLSKLEQKSPRASSVKKIEPKSLKKTLLSLFGGKKAAQATEKPEIKLQVSEKISVKKEVQPEAKKPEDIKVVKTTVEKPVQDPSSGSTDEFDFDFGDLDEAAQRLEETLPVRDTQLVPMAMASVVSSRGAASSQELVEIAPPPIAQLAGWIDGAAFPCIEPTYPRASAGRFPSLAPREVKGLIAKVEGVIAPEIAPQKEAVLQKEIEQPQKVESFSLTPEASDTELKDLFDSCFKDLPAADPDGFEISASAMLSDDDKEQITLLFDLASRSFIDDRIEERFQNSGLDSTIREVVSRSAEKRLKQAEEAMNTPVFSLKNLTKGKKGDTQLEEQELHVHQPATANERFFAWLYDMLFIFGLATVTGLCYSFFAQQRLSEYFLQQDSPFYPMASKFVFGNISTAMAIAFVLYPIISYLSCGSSLGAKFSDCALYRDGNQKKAGFSKHLLRHFLLPITTAFTLIGLIPALIGGRSVADHLTRSDLCSTQRTVSPLPQTSTEE